MQLFPSITYAFDHSLSFSNTLLVLLLCFSLCFLCFLTNFNVLKIQSFFLFATRYHQLTEKKKKGCEKMVMEVVQEDMNEGDMQCTEHPFKNNNTPSGGICAFCLQEKLGKLVSSSFSVAIFPSVTCVSSSSSSPPSFRSDLVPTIINPNPNLNLNPSATSASTNYHSRKAKLPFLLTQRKKKKKEAMIAAADGNNNIVFKRSKTTTSTRNASLFMQDYDSEDYNNPQRKGSWWSFFYLHSTTTKKSKREEEVVAVVVDESESSPDQARKVSRSRSVGCGSRSFSGDFLERISTGFGDCSSTLRRVESQREGNNNSSNKPRIHSMPVAAVGGGGGGQDCIKERVKCGGIFSGFIITSNSSSTSSSSSSYLVPTNEDTSSSSSSIGKKTTTPGRSHHHHVRNQDHHARSKSWGWAFASPMRAFTKPSSSSSGGKRKSSNNVTPNLAAIPSLLTARG